MAREQTPPWRRVAGDLRERIKAGEFPPGAPLPSATTLADEYGVSRATAGKAVRSLVDEGLAVSERGWGVFVRQRS